MADWMAVIDGDDERSGLREEIVQHVIDIGPRYEPGEKFAVHEYTEEQAIEKQHRTRLFQVGDWHNVETYYIGDSTFGYRLTGTIKIIYPNGERWRTAGLSDFAAIAKALTNDQSYPAGVDYRFVDTKEDPPFEDLDDEQWQIMKVSLLAAVMTT
jgi:hypothetical protein